MRFLACCPKFNLLRRDLNDRKYKVEVYKEVPVYADGCADAFYKRSV